MLSGQNTVTAHGACRKETCRPILWSLVADGLLVGLNKEGIYTHGYDLDLLITGKCASTV
jgi:hypothetical protein